MDNQELQKSIDRFIRAQRRRRITSDNRDLLLTQIIDQAPDLELGWVDGALAHLTLLQRQRVEAPALGFLEAIKKLNSLNKAKRLFALETLNLLGGAEQIQGLVETLTSGLAENRKKLAMSLLLSFRGTDKVTDLLLNSPTLFTAKTADSQKHALVSFRFEMAEKLMALFTKPYLATQSKTLGIDQELSLDLLRGILADARLTDLSRFLESDEVLTLKLGEVIASIQGHRMLPIYAKKRYDYLRDFFVRLSEPARFLGVDGSDLSKVCAAFLWTNLQLTPPQSLVGKMTDRALYALPSTKTELNRFLENLAPSTLDALIKDIKDLINTLCRATDADLNQLFATAKAKYELGEPDHSLFGQIYGGLMELKVMGLVALNQVEELIDKVRRDISGEPKAQKSLDEVFDQAPDVDGVEGPQQVEKNPDFSRLFRAIRPVSTTVVGFRGPKEGAGKRATQVNQRVFGNQKSLLSFKEGLEVLMDYYRAKGHHVEQFLFQPKNFPKPVVETHLTYLSSNDEDPLLLCCGITFFEQDRPIPASANAEDQMETLAEQYFLPYYFTMATGHFHPVLHARSRKIIGREEGKNEEASFQANLYMLEFKGLDMGHSESLRVASKQMLALFHGLPDNLWRLPEVQESVNFLMGKLKLAL